ncbi:MAG: PocR ligand-binding domain-containing protein [Prolixibacteraceae bacterium]
MEYKLNELIDLRLFQSLQDKLNEIYSFPSAIIDLEGNILMASDWQDICTKFHRLHPQCEKECIKSDLYINEHLHEANPAVSYKCPHGLVDNAIPIIIGGKHLANFFTGQFFLEKPDLDFFKKQAKKYGFDESSYLKAVSRVPVWEKERLDQYISAIKAFTEILAEIGYKQMQELEARKAYEEVNKQLRASQDRLHRAELISKSGHWEYNINTGEFIASEGAIKIYGAEGNQLNLDFVRKARIQEYNQLLDNALDNLIKRDVPYNVEFKIECFDTGEIKDIHSTAYYDREQGVVLGLIQDVTEKKEIERLVNLLAHSLESISECVSIADTEDRIIYVNESFLNTYGYKLDELIGQHISIVRPPELKDYQVRNFLTKTVEGGWRGEIMNKRKDGSFFPILLSSSAIKDENGKLIAMIGVALDITEMRKNRDELIEAKQRAEENNRLRFALLNNMSHEIRTPMNAIMGFSELMKEADEEEKNAYAEIIHNSSDQLLSLIDDVILLSRLQSEKMPLQISEFSPSKLIAEICMMFNHPNLSKGLHIREKTPFKYRNLMINADFNKIRQVLTNFLSNAVKYTSDGHIEVGFEVNNSQIGFFVSDTGMGISKHELQLIFDAFYRGEQAISMAIRGTGLGLNIAKELIDIMGGKIGVESELDKGSRFYFNIPLEQSYPDVQGTLAKRSNIIDKEKLSILIVDDEFYNIHYLKTVLKGKVQCVDLAINGKEAIEKVRSKKYDLILMDLKMPVMGGLEATKILKAEFPELPVVVQTACAFPEEKELALNAGCDGYIVKPITRDKMFDVISRLG